MIACTIDVHEGHATFYFDPFRGSGAYAPSWPYALSQKFLRNGTYVIHHLRKSTTATINLQIIGTGDYGVPARFVERKGERYGLCSRFLRELGVTPPPEGKQKTLHLVVTKRRAKK